MALIRNIAGIGMVAVANEQDYETFKCADPGCTTVGEGGTIPFLDDNGPYVYKQVPGSGIYPQYVEMPVETIEPNSGGGMVTTTQDVQPPVNVMTVGPVTPEPTERKTDTTGLLILAAMGVILLQNERKGFAYPGLYLGGVAALYYHLKK